MYLIIKWSTVLFFSEKDIIFQLLNEKIMITRSVVSLKKTSFYWASILTLPSAEAPRGFCEACPCMPFVDKPAWCQSWLITQNLYSEVQGF